MEKSQHIVWKHQRIIQIVGLWDCAQTGAINQIATWWQNSVS